MNDVSRRLVVIDTIRNVPEILEVEIPPIVYITGLERSGTTILHNLLALHPQLRPLLRWELMDPVPPPTTATYASDPRIAAVQTSIEPLRGSLLEHLHWADADQPEASRTRRARPQSSTLRPTSTLELPGLDHDSIRAIPAIDA